MEPRTEVQTGNARARAFSVVFKILTDKSYSNIAVAGTLRDHSLKGADKAFFTALVYGVTERRLTLDYNLSLYLKQPLKKLNPKAYTALLLGAYQLLFMERVPDHAAINESVKLVKKNGAAFAASLVNAVLHRVAEHGLQLPDKDADPLQYRSVRWSCPAWLVTLFTEAYGEENADGILEASLGAPDLVVRVNTVKTTVEELTERLKEEGIAAVPHELVPDALILTGAEDLTELPSFAEGLCHVQDAASQLCCARLDPQPGDTVYDLCAAPGGKTFTLAERMGNEGTVCAFDLYPQRVGLIAAGAARLGLSIVEARTGNAEEFDPSLAPADRILCDVPCSGLGVLSRKPEIRYKEAQSIDILPELQYHILYNSMRYLKPGGTLVYSTCSLNPAENEQVCKRLSETLPEAKLCSMETLLPHVHHCDGFFIAVFRKETGA